MKDSSLKSKEIDIRILEAAKDVFVRKGYSAATMSDVASEAGMGRTALHYYYRTKDILFDAVFGQLLTDFLPNIDRVLDKDCSFLQKLADIIDLYIGIIRANPSFPKFVLSEINRDYQHLIATLSKNANTIMPLLRLRQNIEEEMEKGSIRKMPIVDLFTTIVSLVVFPMLIKEPLTDLLLENNPDEFEIFLNRRKDLICEIVTQLLSPR